MIVRSMNVRAPGFPRDEHDDGMPNSFMSGHALASFVAQRLKEQGYREDDLIAEDWGWLLMLRDGKAGLPLEVHFACLATPDDDPAGEHEYVVSIEPCQPKRRRMLVFTEDISDPVRRFSKAVFGVVGGADGIVVLDTETIAFD